MMELIEQSQVALDEVIDVAGRAMIEALLRLSAEGMAGPPHPGKKGGAIGWDRRGKGNGRLEKGKVGVKPAGFRKKGAKGGGGGPGPAYETMAAGGEAGGASERDP